MSGKKMGDFPICHYNKRHQRVRWRSFEMRASRNPVRVSCVFLQRSSSSVYPGFFKTPLIGVGPHDNQWNDKSLAEKIPDISFSQRTNSVGLVTRQLLE
jgi:hypothetical protein